MNEPRMISLRWRVLVPVVVILVVVTTAAYLMARNIDMVPAASADNLLYQTQSAIRQQADMLHADDQRIARSLSAIPGINDALSAGDAAAISDSVARIIRRQNLDDVILTDSQGAVVAGWRWDGSQYRPLDAAGVDLELLSLGQPVSGFALVNGETLLYTAQPVRQGEAQIGSMLVGRRLTRLLSSLHTSALAEVALFGPDQQLLASTMPVDTPLSPSSTDTIQPVDLAGESYQSLAFPLNYGNSTPGTMNIYLPRNIGAGVGQQLNGLLLAVAAAAVVIVVYVAISMITMRLRHIIRTLEALSHGERTARTHMQPVDEVGRLGQALDQYADYAQERQDALRASLRRQRRENEHLTAVLEALSDGVIVQDIDGRVILMNEKARDLLGSKRVLRSNPDLLEMTAFVTDQLGPVLAPGIYTLGEPQRIHLDQYVVSAQVAAVMALTGQRLGTVIMLHDVTEAAQKEAARDALLRQMQAEIQEPLADLAPTRPGEPASPVMREIRTHASALQKMILEMRELTDAHLKKTADERQRPLLLDTLVWVIANEWRQVALAQNLKLHVILEQSGLYVLGEERRLRWAIGNIVDNAIKYTPPGGDLTIEVRDDISDGRAHLRVRDNGVGIAREELGQVFTRFYRGKPTTPEGRQIRVPGSGQGLTTARQIFEAHGGSIRIKSKPGVGTAVYFTIPLTAPISYELPQTNDLLEGETVRIDTTHLNHE